MISIHSLTKKYGKQQALKAVSLEFTAAQSIGLIGPNGSGKTTLLKAILGLLHPDSGIIAVNGSDIKKAYAYRQHIGYVPQGNRLPEHITVANLFSMLKKLRNGYRNKYDTELYDHFGIDTVQNKYGSTLSGGMRQQVSVALAFYFSPSILILDEPTAGLDPVSNELLKLKIIKCRNEGKLVITTSHVLSDLDEIADHVIYMNDGEINFFDKLETLKERTAETTLDKIILKLIKQQGKHG